MSGNDILQEEENAKNLKRLLDNKKNLVPFIGAGFSVPACPTWSEFLDLFFQGLKEGEFLQAGDEAHYLQLKTGCLERKYERLADFLVKRAGRRKFEEEIKAHFLESPPAQMMPKYNLLHRAFPGLKITTNFDGLVENSAPGVWVVDGSHAGDMNREFTFFEKNALLKIHGGVRDIRSIVLDSQRYAELYGDARGFDPQAALPAFLSRVFTNCSLLFIGCSLVHDRTLMIMESLDYKRPHFAILKRPETGPDRVELNRRLSDMGITPIRISDFAQVEEILRQLAEPAGESLETALPDHGVPFVGRVEQLAQIRENLDQAAGSGNIQVIAGRLFSIEGAGGVGKTTLALEAAKRFKGAFPDGVLKPIRVDEHTPVSFAVHLAALLRQPMEEPADVESARELVSRLLLHRQCLVILDNAPDWHHIKYMLPEGTASTILITTRSRDMYRHLRLRCTALRVHEIRVEKFTPAEALDLFKAMLAEEYREAEENIYLETAANLGYLPIALRQAISLMVFTPHYRAGELRERLGGEDRLEWLRKGQAAEDSDSRAIAAVFDLSSPLLTAELVETLEYLAVCGPGPVPLDFLRLLAKDREEESDIAERLEHLYTYSWCERRESGGAGERSREYELHQLVRELVRARFQNRFQDRFIRLVHDLFTGEGVHFTVKERYYPQLEEALAAASAKGDERLKKWLYDLYDFCAYRGYADFYIRLTQQVERLFPGDRWALRTAYAHRALIYRRQGKLAEAMKYHKKEEKIEEELGNRKGLAQSYGNQALVLKAWGKLTEAMDLHKKQENICEELGDRAGLAICYDNQAIIHREFGKLDEAMNLHRKEEKIFEQLGMLINLAECYGNQTLILIEWDDLNGARNLCEKEEKICTELEDRAGLARNYWNQGLIYKKEKNYRQQIKLWKQSIQINQELGIPTTEDEKALEELLKEIGEC